MRTHDRVEFEFMLTSRQMKRKPEWPISNPKNQNSAVKTGPKNDGRRVAIQAPVFIQKNASILGAQRPSAFRFS